MAALDGQHALITGGGSGIGLACAAALCAEGANVTLMGRTLERLESGVAQLKQTYPDAAARIALVQGDTSNEEQVAAAVSSADARAPLTIAIANAGTGTLGNLMDTQTSEWQRVMTTNLDGTFFVFKHAANAIATNGGGAMCAISSIAGLRTHRMMGTYCTSKAAIDMLVRSAADEMGAQNIRVNSVCPGLVETELSEGLHSTPDILNDYLECMPLARVGAADNIAHAVRFLCGPEASWITGTTLPVDGGHHLRRGPNLAVASES